MRFISPRRVNYRYFRIDEGVQAMRATVDIPWGGPRFHICAWNGIRTRRVTSNFDPSDKMPSGKPADAVHNVGPMEHFEALTADVRAGTGSVFWENRGRPEYERPHDLPAPDVPITGTLTLSKYAVAFALDGQNLIVTNKLADIEGRVEFYDGKLKSFELVGSERCVSGSRSGRSFRSRSMARECFFRVAGPVASDAFLLNCTEKERGCFVAAQQSVRKQGTTLVVDGPKRGDWRIIIRTREATNRAVNYHVREAALEPSMTSNPPPADKYATGKKWSVPAPVKQSDVQYAAFRISGTAGNEDEKDGVRIAMTPLTKRAP